MRTWIGVLAIASLVVACGPHEDNDAEGDSNPDSPKTMESGSYTVSDSTLVSDTCESGLDPTIYDGLRAELLATETELILGGITLARSGNELLGLLEDGQDWNEAGIDCILLMTTAYTGTIPQNNQIDLVAEEITSEYDGAECASVPTSYPVLPCDTTVGMTYSLEPQ